MTTAQQIAARLEAELAKNATDEGTAALCREVRASRYQTEQFLDRVELLESRMADQG